MSDWLALANFVLNTLFIPLLVILVQIKTSIAALEVKLEDEKARVSRLQDICDRRHIPGEVQVSR